MDKPITITINDEEYKVDPGQTIMQAADTCGYRIPRLCYHPKLSVEGACRKVCPVGAISGSPKSRHVIDPEKCIRCGLCFNTCKFEAITKA